MKTCKDCKILKASHEFWKNSKIKDGLDTYCLVCSYARIKISRAKDSTAINRANAKWRAKNPRHTTAYKLNRLKTDLEYKIGFSARNRITQAIRNGSKGGSALRDLGCSIPELKSHLELRFKPGMSWSNWSREGWHIDHIIPLVMFNLTDEHQFKKAVHYTNLQPLWAHENYSKNRLRKSNIMRAL